MCIVCRGEYNDSTTTLNCSYCKNLTSLPDLPNVTELFCESCPSLTSLPALPNVTRLYCDSCPSLTSLPALPNATRLFCNNCSSLTSLPSLPNVTRLVCSYCPSLTSLPVLPNVTYLDCSNCPSLTSLPTLPNVTYLDCNNCPWLNQNNPKFEDNIRKLCTLQKNVKKILNRRRDKIVRILLPFLPKDIINIIIPEIKGVEKGILRWPVTKKKSWITKVTEWIKSIKN